MDQVTRNESMKKLETAQFRLIFRTGVKIAGSTGGQFSMKTILTCVKSFEQPKTRVQLFINQNCKICKGVSRHFSYFLYYGFRKSMQNSQTSL